MKVIELFRGRRQQQAASNEQQYRLLIVKAATAGGELKDTDQSALEALADALRLEPEQVAADIAIVQRHRQLSAIVDQRAQAIQRMEAATANEGKTRDDADRQFLALRKKVDDAAAERVATEAAYSKVEKASADLAELEADAWRILGRPNPNVKDVRRCIAHSTRSRQVTGWPHETIEIGAVFATPPADQFRGLEFVQGPSQSKADFERLKDLAIRASHGEFAGKTLAYLTDQPIEDPPAIHAGQFVGILHELLRIIAEQKNNPEDDYVFIPLPEQTEREFDKLLARVREAVKANASKPRVVITGGVHELH